MSGLKERRHESVAWSRRVGRDQSARIHATVDFERQNVPLVS